MSASDRAPTPPPSSRRPSRRSERARARRIQTRGRGKRFDASFAAGFHERVRNWGGVIFPRETGALAQILVALTTTLVIARFRPGALAIAGSAFALFLSHEPFLIVTGLRGPRARHKYSSRAWRQLGVAPLLALVLAGVGLVLGPQGTWWTILVPLAPIVPLTPLVFGRLEKTVQGEVLVAITLAAFTLPVARAGGVSLTSSVAVASVYLAMLVVATLAVRRVTARALRAMTLARYLWPVTTLVTSLGALIAFSATGIFPAALPLAPIPMFSFSLFLVLRPPHLRHIRKVGWTLAGTMLLSSITLAVIVG